MVERSTEARHSASLGLHRRSADVILAALLDAQRAAVESVRPAFADIARASDTAAEILARGGKVGYAGAGSSGLMALADCLELAGTFGVAPEQTPMMFAGGAESLIRLRGSAEDDAAMAQADFHAADLSTGDMVIVLTASGTTPYAMAIAEAARARGVVVVGMANATEAPLHLYSDIPILLDTGAELVAGSTRMGAATAQKVALNMFSVLMAVRLGHVHDGYMVNVIADNAKLVRRAARIVSEIAEVSADMAEAALIATKGAVKQAILVARGMEPERAQVALAESDGHLEPLLG
ncbi:N-acetylmuramic acid 6-phosphate etherase [Paracoccus fistulariae]|uniref:N-acetylmuramic acid 6-phosphate etherase n=1 Tax=Paracoccus fistulariae TaxID=658446 RepID=A0ABY7SFF5_9RHOB|nr:N-acetylmuramic acid 6-phosphate etherase [Paracoccus fistulariae]MDB6182720.1 N-acetylmuramic acid 6-phosphate etherase [Paracoccus fistulariae]WCR05716.1 N-acetylmuramic acid 6-phosphate etherase [Paracoccus fistulariae]